jgi:hypothetical protein
VSFASLAATLQSEVFAFLTATEHFRLAACSHSLATVSRLATSAPHEIRVPVVHETDLPASLLRQQLPRILDASPGDGTKGPGGRFKWGVARRRGLSHILALLTAPIASRVTTLTLGLGFARSPQAEASRLSLMPAGAETDAFVSSSSSPTPPSPPSENDTGEKRDGDVDSIAAALAGMMALTSLSVPACDDWRDIVKIVAACGMRLTVLRLPFRAPAHHDTTLVSLHPCGATLTSLDLRAPALSTGHMMALAAKMPHVRHLQLRCDSRVDLHYDHGYDLGWIAALAKLETLELENASRLMPAPSGFRMDRDNLVLRSDAVFSESLTALDVSRMPEFPWAALSLDRSGDHYERNRDESKVAYGARFPALQTLRIWRMDAPFRMDHPHDCQPSRRASVRHLPPTLTELDLRGLATCDLDLFEALLGAGRGPLAGRGARWYETTGGDFRVGHRRTMRERIAEQPLQLTPRPLRRIVLSRDLVLRDEEFAIPQPRDWLARRFSADAQPRGRVPLELVFVAPPPPSPDTDAPPVS